MARLRAALARSFDLYAFSILVLALVLLPVQGNQPSAPTQQPTSPQAAAMPAPTAQHMQFCGLWRVDGSFRSTILVNSVLVTQPLTVQPTLFMADGARYDLAPVKIAPGDVAQVSVNDALAGAPASLGPHLSDYGSAAVSFSWPWDTAVAADMQVLNVPESLIYRYPFNSVTAGAPSPHALEGLWWKRDPGVGGFVALANVSEQPLQVSLRVIGSRGVTLPADFLTLAAHATQTLDLNELLAGLPADEADAGGIRVEYNGQMGELIVSGGLEEVEKGYSATLPFYPHDPDGSSPSTVSYASTGIMAGRPDPSMGFPKDTRFTPYAYVRNTTSAAMEVGPTVYFMSGKNPASLALPNLQLAPYQASEVPLAAALAQQRLADYSGMITITLAFRGHAVDLLEAAGSVDQTGTYVFEVTPHVVAPGGAKHAPFWDVAGGNDTMITLWNPAGMPEDIVATFLFAGGSGHYRLPLHLAGYASQSIDVAQLIAAEQPDFEGNLIPPSAEQGSVEFSGPSSLSDQISLAIEGGTFNVQTATCGDGTYCIICVGLASCAVSPNPTNVSVGSSSQATATGTYSNGSTENDTSKSSWSSSATSIATVETKGDANPGLVSGVSPGTATVTVDDPSFASGKACGLFPTCTVVIVACSLPVNAAPFITSISPAQGPIGASTAVTISGVGFGTSPTVSAGSGITVSVNSASDTQIQATFQIATTAPAGNHTVTVTAAGQTSNGVNFFVQVPTSLQMVTGSSTQKPIASCTILVNGQQLNAAGWERDLEWQVMDQRTPPVAIQASNLSPSDSLQNAGGTNSCGFPATGGKTGTGVTDASGQFPDMYSTCSTACLNGGNCQSTELQTWTVAGSVLSNDVKTVVYTCTGITVNGQ